MRSALSENEDGDGRAAASKVAMRSGCHSAQFTLRRGHDVDMMLGVIRPGWDVEGGGRDERGVACTTRATGAASPATRNGRVGRRRGSRATASACCSTSTRAA